MTTATLHKNRNGWRIVWYRDREQFALYLSGKKNDELAAQDKLARVQLALMEAEDWPDEFKNSKVVIKYLGIRQDNEQLSVEGVIEKYMSTIQNGITKEWAKKTKSHIKKFSEYTDIATATYE